VDSSGTGIDGASLKEAIRRGQIVTVHRGTDGTHPTLVVERVEDPADAGSSLTLDALKNVDAPASTPTGMFLGTTAVGAWGAVANPTAGLWPGKTRTSRPNSTDRLVEMWDGAAWCVVHYDSGWRDVKVLLTPTALAQVETWSTVRLRRIGDVIHFEFIGNIGTGSIATTDLKMDTITLPQGFWADTSGPIGVAASWYDYYTHVVSTSDGNNLPAVMPLSGAQKWQNGSIRGAVQFLTAQPLPTSLPGTLISTAH
jgi:hypothetical protein